MAITVTDYANGAERISQNMGILTGTVAFDTSYPTGGEDTSGISGYFQTCLVIIFIPTAGYVFQYDKANDTVLVYQSDYSFSADAPLVEVADTTDLSTPLASVQFIAIGFI